MAMHNSGIFLDPDKRGEAIQRWKNNFSQSLRAVYFRERAGVIHKGRRSHTRVRIVRGKSWVEKLFWLGNDEGRAFKMEMTARKVFGACAWFPPLTRTGWRRFRRPYYPEKSILYCAAGNMDQQTRAVVLAQAMDMLFDIFMAGYAHRDFHAGNLYWVDNQLILVDFEALGAYVHGQRPAFPESYDLTGHGMDSPYRTGNMSFVRAHEWSLSAIFGVSKEQGLQSLVTRLKKNLRLASLQFQKASQRHTCEAERIYSSFALPYLSVAPCEAQRNSDRRFKRFGIHNDLLRGKRILDLGSNIGGMLFSAQQYLPGQCLGIEYDGEKVQIAREVAAYNGLNNVHFLQADIDKLTLRKTGGTFDVVFCLAIEAHVKKKLRLYRLLSRVTRDTVLFEGNANSDPQEVIRHLRGSGFRTVDFLGMCDDDCLPQNNNRPLFVARK